MRLHEHIKLFKEAVTITAQKMELKKIYVEKDYWVTYVIRSVFKDPLGEEVIFKGGTSLQKCFDMIQRFSEDIDLVILRKGTESSNQLITKLRKIGKIVNRILPEIHIENFTHKRGMIRKTAHEYQKEFSEDYGQIKDFVAVEATWLGYFEPYTNAKVSSFVYQMMKENGQAELAKEYGMEPFDVLVLEPRRTFCEKIMSLVRFSYTDDAMIDLGLKIRHCYDLTKMLENSELSEFFDSEVFDSMLLKVADDDIVSFKNNNQWLKYHPSEALIFSDSENVWSELKKIYNSGFRNLVFGKLPDENEILRTLLRIKDRVAKVEWKIKV
ncbi:MAG: nucleotidyl transferase AbiEii/AbiGii toxin family protein [Candidatus Delongbacteria bacterium]|nr:nucleotidyl transferase AbiEii/AbiGii toxin family protein [Candidatus Delongbacteria bacterium]